MPIAKITLPDIDLTPEQSTDRRVHQLLTALNDALDDLERYGVRVGQEGVQFTWHGTS